MTAFSASSAASAISKYRRRNGLPAVTLDRKLTAAAQEKARHMAAGGGIDHAGARRRIEAAGFDPTTAGENIGAGCPTFDDMLAGWKNSPGHNANLLKREATHIGIAVVEAPRTTYKYFWCLIIAAPAVEASVIDRKQQARDVLRGPLQLPVGPETMPRWRRWLGW